jgi:hypothetical protein
MAAAVFPPAGGIPVPLFFFSAGSVSSKLPALAKPKEPADE